MQIDRRVNITIRQNLRRSVLTTRHRTYANDVAPGMSFPHNLPAPTPGVSGTAPVSTDVNHSSFVCALGKAKENRTKRTAVLPAVNGWLSSASWCISASFISYRDSRLQEYSPTFFPSTREWQRLLLTTPRLSHSLFAKTARPQPPRYGDETSPARSSATPAVSSSNCTAALDRSA